MLQLENLYVTVLFLCVLLSIQCTGYSIKHIYINIYIENMLKMNSYKKGKCVKKVWKKLWTKCEKKLFLNVGEKFGGQIGWQIG